MRNRLFPLVAFVMVLCMAGCTPSMQNVRQTNEVVEIYPDYKDVTVPVNIAPLDFEVLVDSDSKCKRGHFNRTRTIRIKRKQPFFLHFF